MNAMFLPAISLLDKLGFRAKFAVIFFSVMVPLSVLSYFVLSSVNVDVNLLRNETRGAQFIVSAKESLITLQAARLRSAGAVTAGSNTDVQRSLDSLLTQAEALRAPAELQQDIRNLNRQWQDIPAGASRQQVYAAQTTLIEQLNLIIRQASIYFELTLSPNLDTYFLSDALVHGLPSTLDSANKLLIALDSRLPQGFLSTTDQIELSLEIDKLESAINLLNERLTVALDYDSALSQALGRPLSELMSATETLSTMVRNRVLGSSGISVTVQEAREANSRVISAASGLFDAIAPQLSARINDKLTQALTIRAVDIAMIAAALFILVYMFSSLYVAIHRSVDAIKDTCQSLASGVLSSRANVQSSDELNEIAEGINSVANRFEELIKNIVSATIQLAAAAEELSGVSRHSADNVLQQRAETDMVAVSINEMNATVQEVSRSTVRASEAALHADEQAAKGVDVAKRTASSIVALSADINSSSQSIERVSADSQSISGVLDVIMGVAEQTNLLALNAAIEAARAGEHGRGFAVVADEVRTLANRTLHSASEIEMMIRNLQSGVKDAVTQMERSRERATSGVQLANEASEALTIIMHSVSTIKDMNLQIATASEQQSATTEELNRNVTSIRSLAEQSAAGAAQTTVASDELAQLAANLQSSVSWFRVSA